MWTHPGSVYGVDNKITNKGPPLADSFVLKEHIRCCSIKTYLVDYFEFSEFHPKVKVNVTLS